MRAILLTACLALTGGPALHDALPQSTRPPAGTTITIDATVVDRNGRSVPDLVATDFTVELNGRGQRILAVTYLPAGPPMAGGIGPVFDAVTMAAPVYRLVIEPPDGTSPGSEFTAAVVVSRPGTKVQADARAVARTGTERTVPSPAATAALSTTERLRTAIATGRAEPGLPLRLGRTLRRGPDPAQLLLDVQIEIPSSAKPPLTALLGVVDPGGAIRTAGKNIAATHDGGAYRLDFSLPLTAGPHKVRFGAADAAGTIGAVEAAVSAELATMGPFRASDLLRWTAGTDGPPRPLMLDDLPAGAASVGATLELYSADGANAMPDLLVRFSLVPAGAGGETAAIERIVTPEARQGILVAEAEFPVERLEKGTYLLRAAVNSGTTVLGTASATLIKR